MLKLFGVFETGLSAISVLDGDIKTIKFFSSKKKLIENFHFIHFSCEKLLYKEKNLKDCKKLETHVTNANIQYSLYKIGSHHPNISQNTTLNNSHKNILCFLL